jgi:cyclic beta-1,2-glucan synthetase
MQRTNRPGPGEEIELVFLLGRVMTSRGSALVERYREPTPRRSGRRWQRWSDVLGTVQVKTPDRSFDLMINHWLLYQALACRVIGSVRLLPGRGRRTASETNSRT